MYINTSLFEKKLFSLLSSMFSICFEGCEKRKMDKHPISLRNDEAFDRILTPEEYDQRAMIEPRVWFDDVVNNIEKVMVQRLYRGKSLSERVDIPFFSNSKSLEKKLTDVTGDVRREHYCGLFVRSPQYLALVEKFKQNRWKIEVDMPLTRYNGDVLYVSIKRTEQDTGAY